MFSKKIIESGLSDSDKKIVIDLHNELRQKVARGEEKRGSPGPQPPAKFMPDLEWDDELAAVAQKWADKCIWGHDRARDVKRFKVGQNIAYLSTTGDINSLKIEEMVYMWYDEVVHYSKDDVVKFRNKGANNEPIGHYTQMIWAKTTKMGCGAVKYRDGNYNKFYIVCNYGPAGNYLDQPLYETR